MKNLIYKRTIHLPFADEFFNAVINADIKRSHPINRLTIDK